MRFPVKEVILVDVKKGISKKGNELTFVKIADELTYENETFITNQDLFNFKNGEKVHAQLIVQNAFTSIELHKLK